MSSKLNTKPSPHHDNTALCKQVPTQCRHGVVHTHRQVAVSSPSVLHASLKIQSARTHEALFLRRTCTHECAARNITGKLCTQEILSTHTYQHRVQAARRDGVVERRAGRLADGTVATLVAQRRLEAGVDGRLGAA